MSKFDGEVLLERPQEPASVAVAPPSSADEVSAKNDAEFASRKEKMKSDYDEKNKANSMAGMSDVKFGDFETQIPTFFTTAPGVITAGAAAYGAGVGLKKAAESGAEGLKKVYGSLRDFSKEKFGDDGLLANQQTEKAAKQAEMTPKEISATQTPTTETPLETKVKPLQSIEKKIIEQGAANTELKASTAEIKAAERELAAGAAKGLPPPSLTTGSGMPAYQGSAPEGTRVSKSISSLEKVPKDMVFVPQGQYMDIVRNAVGQEPYTANLKATGGYPVSPEAAYKQSREINQSLGRLARDEAISQNKSLGEVTKSITKKIGGSKTVKVAGVGGALISLADLANAAEEGVSAAKQGDTQMARGYATDILGALTGPLGMIASQTFGTSPEDLRVLRAAEQARKVGAGRGIAPPSAYKR